MFFFIFAAPEPVQFISILIKDENRHRNSKSAAYQILNV